MADQMQQSPNVGFIATEDTAQAIAGLVTSPFNSIDFTYVAAGNGVGQTETATFKFGVTTVATLTFTYNASNKVTNVTKT